MESMAMSPMPELSLAPEPTDTGPSPPKKQIESPRILLAATLRWPLAARLAIAFRNLGSSVSAWCPLGHPLEKTNAVERNYSSGPLARSSSLSEAILLAKPDFIIPCDDDAAILLHLLYEGNRHDPKSRELCNLIERSLGRPSSCSLATARGCLMQLAEEQGVRVPLTERLSTATDLDSWGARNGFPAVIKVDKTWGGQGVSVVHSMEEAHRAYQLASSPSVFRALSHLVLRRDPSYLFSWIKRTDHVVTIQKYISGRTATLGVACWQGQVMAEISAIALQTQSPNGPASVIQIVKNAEMSESATRMVAVLGLSGLCGLDFVIEANTGDAYLIEVNPRGTPISYIDLGMGNDLAVSLHAKMSGRPTPDKVSTVSGDVIAMFPGEWRRNSMSHYLSTAFHDVPWTERELVRDCMAPPWEERGVITRIRARMTPRRVRTLVS